MALTYSNGMPLATPAPQFHLRGTDGIEYSLDSFADSDVVVVIFTCNHCPYAQAVEDRLIAFQEAFMGRGVQLVAINSNDTEAYPADNFEAMKRRAKEKKYNFPYLLDATQATARAYDAACTPDIFVFDGDRKLRYNGRFDDNWQHPEQVTQRDLERAVECVLADRPVDFKAVPSMGCNIKWRSPVEQR